MQLLQNRKQRDIKINFMVLFGLLFVTTFGVAVAFADLQQDTRTTVYTLFGAVAGYLAGIKKQRQRNTGTQEQQGNTRQGRTAPAAPARVLWGPRASGRSQLLDQLEREFSQGRPYVRRTGDQLAGRRPHHIALVLAFFLGQRVEGFGRLKFRRHIVNAQPDWRDQAS